jgi:hypothetical protein
VEALLLLLLLLNRWNDDWAAEGDAALSPLTLWRR